MSFRGGGRGGFSKQLLPFGLEYSDLNGLGVEKDENKLPLPINGATTQLEKDTAQQYINFQSIISEGPFYTGSLQLLKVSKEKTASLYDDGDGINDGIKRYSDKYRKKRKIGRSIDEHPYILEFFPEELYSVMGIDKKQKRKLLSLSKFARQNDSLAFLQKASDDLKLNDLLQELKSTDEATLLATVGAVKDDEEDEEPIEEDEEFDEDDDDDYNAEKYFDDGDDDDDLGDDDDDEAAF